ncbi:MAG: hypothetical protein IPG51_05590 [Chloroflexi bacterium]|nr:hypothetical protein [Chloroflexota bacterium]
MNQTGCYILCLILYVQGKDILVFTAAMFIIIGVFLLIYSLRIPRLQQRWLLWLAFGSLILGNILMVGRTFGQPIPGILSTFPLVALSFVYIGEEQNRTKERHVYLLVLLTTLYINPIMIKYGSGKQ